MQFDLGNTLVTIPLGERRLRHVWIEAVGTVFGLLCASGWPAQEKTINYLFGLINVTLFAVIFSRSSSMGCCSPHHTTYRKRLSGWYKVKSVHTLERRRSPGSALAAAMAQLIVTAAVSRSSPNQRC